MTTQRMAHGRDRVSRSALRTGRERYREALKQLVKNHGANCFSDKATILLTRHWAETPWNGRADLLQAADWLIRLSADFANSRLKNIP